MQEDDKVWFDTYHKFAGICAEVSEPKLIQNTLLLAHFPATLAKLETSLESAAIGFRRYSPSDNGTLCSTDGRVVTGLVRSFQPGPAQLGNPFLRTLQIIVAEHHPIYGRDKYVIDTAEGWHCKPAVCFHIGLDDPLMQHFGSDQIVSLFKKLGADEADPISNPLVTRAIRGAQLKIETQVPKDLQAESIEDWFRYNLKKEWG